MVSFYWLGAILPVFSVVNGHMIMKTPIPYGKGVINNSPLAADGSDFPCKNLFDMTDPSTDVNTMAIGDPQTLSFTGTAVHGGGSCQVAFTTDLKPTKSSKWMVIKSIEGGCPADAPGNLASDDTTTFQYTVPAGISPGQYTIAWSWVNKIGNREYYMNCGRADITAAKKKRYAPAPQTDISKRTDFPDLFVANLAGVSNGCATTEGIDILYPNPGDNVQKSSDGHFGPPTGCQGSTPDTPSGGDGSASAGSSGSDSSAAAPTVTATSSGVAGGSTSTATGNPGVFAGGAASPSGGSDASSTSTAAASTATATSGSSSGGSSGSESSSGSDTPTATATGSGTPSPTGGASGSCTEGNWNCAADGKSFQRCASGAWSVAISMAAGTSCTPGESATLQMGATPAKRNLMRRRNVPFQALA